MTSITVAAAIVLALTTAGSGVSGAQAPTTCATPGPTDALLSFAGEGDQVTEPVTLDAGTYRASYESDSDLFQVQAYTEDGENLSVLSHYAEPPYTGAEVFKLDSSSQIVFEVESEADWSLEIRPLFAD